jgi:hypothetical protein
MTRKQQILDRVKFIVRTEPLGAGRTAALEDLRTKFHISEERLRAICLHQSGADYWN